MSDRAWSELIIWLAIAVAGLFSYAVVIALEFAKAIYHHVMWLYF